MASTTTEAAAAGGAGAGAGSGAAGFTGDYRPLHWVFKIGNLKKSMEFYEKVMGMRISRHEEFESGCEATCNGPYGGAWSKTMIGYRSEDVGVHLELTYNYGIDGYERGNDYRYITVAGDAAKMKAAAEELGFGVEESKEALFISGPDGDKFQIVPGTPEEVFQHVSINVSDLAAATDFYTKVLPFKVLTGDFPGAVGGDKSVMLGFAPEQFKLELVQSDGAIDFKLAKGRLATETHYDDAEFKIGEQVKAAGQGKILHGPLVLQPHGERVVIIEDLDGYEYCFVDAVGYKNCINVKVNTIDWEYRKSKGGDGNPVPKIAMGDTKDMQVVADDDAWDAILDDCGSTPMIVDCMASWCKKCATVLPVMAELSTKFPAAKFYKVDIDECPAVADENDVLKVPTILFFQDGEVVSRYEGSDTAVVTETVEKFMAGL